MNRDILLDNLDLLSIEVSTIQQLRNLIIDLAVTGKFSQGMFPLELGSEVVRNSLEKSKSNTSENLIDCIAYCEVPSNWSWANTEILCHTQTGATPDKSAVIDKDSIAYITSADIQNFRAHSENRVSRSLEGKKLRIAPSGSILFVGIGNVGRCGVTEIESTFNQQIHSATPYIVNPKFLCFFYSSTFFRNQVNHFSSATTLTILNKSKWSSIPVPVPPIIEQQWIVDKIEELLGICHELEAKLNIRNLVGAAARESAVDAISTAQSSEELQLAWERIQSHWEVIAGSPEAIDSMKTLILDLAVRGDLVSVGSSKVVQSIEWTSSELKLDDSKIWSLSTLHKEKRTGWNRIPLAKIGSWGSGGTPTSSRKDFYQDGTIPWAVIGDLNNDIMTITEASITERALAESSSKLVPKGAILIAMYGASIGKTALTGIECCTNQAIAHCIVDTKLVSKDYFFIVAKSLKRHLIQEGKGAAQPNISQSVLKHLIIDLPPLAEQALIVERVDALMQLCDRLNLSLHESEVLAEKFARSVVSASA